MSWPALEKENLFQPSLASTRESENSKVPLPLYWTSTVDNLGKTRLGKQTLGNFTNGYLTLGKFTLDKFTQGI